MWAQNWENIYSIVQPFKGKPEIEVTPALKAQVTFTNLTTVIFNDIVLHKTMGSTILSPLGFSSFFFWHISITTQRQ